jgi:WxL domain surface cell wall-binding
MARRLPAVALLALAALALGGAVARATNLTVNATVAGGTTLSVGSLNAPSFALTLNGDDQTATYQAQLQVVDARGLATGGGWNLTLNSTQFSNGAGKTLPTNASTISSVTTACHTGSTCTVPTNNVSNSNVAMPIAPASTKILNAANLTGLGRVDVNVNVNVAVPANTLAATYASTLTVTIASGP